MNTVHRSRPGHWADQRTREAVFVEPTAGEYVPPAFPFWPFALCVGFPFLVALGIWLARSFFFL